MLNVDKLIKDIERYNIENKKINIFSSYLPEKLKQLSKLDGRYLNTMSKEEIELCGGLPLNLLEDKKGTNIYDCIWFNYTPLYQGLEPRWEIDWDNYEG